MAIGTAHRSAIPHFFSVSFFCFVFLMVLSSNIRGPIYHLLCKIEEEGGLNNFYHSNHNPERLQSHTLHSIALPCLCSPFGGDMTICVLLFPWYLLHLTFIKNLLIRRASIFSLGWGKGKMTAPVGKGVVAS